LTFFVGHSDFTVPSDRFLAFDTGFIIGFFLAGASLSQTSNNVHFIGGFFWTGIS